MAMGYRLYRQHDVQSNQSKALREQRKLRVFCDCMQVLVCISLYQRPQGCMNASIGSHQKLQLKHEIHGSTMGAYLCMTHARADHDS